MMNLSSLRAAVLSPQPDAVLDNSEALPFPDPLVSRPAKDDIFWEVGALSLAKVLFGLQVGNRPLDIPVRNGSGNGIATFQNAQALADAFQGKGAHQIDWSRTNFFNGTLLDCVLEKTGDSLSEETIYLVGYITLVAPEALLKADRAGLVNPLASTIFGRQTAIFNDTGLWLRMLWGGFLANSPKVTAALKEWMSNPSLAKLDPLEPYPENVLRRMFALLGVTQGLREKLTTILTQDDPDGRWRKYLSDASEGRRWVRTTELLFTKNLGKTLALSEENRSDFMMIAKKYKEYFFSHPFAQYRIVVLKLFLANITIEQACAFLDIEALKSDSLPAEIKSGLVERLKNDPVTDSAARAKAIIDIVGLYPKEEILKTNPLHALLYGSATAPNNTLFAWCRDNLGKVSDLLVLNPDLMKTVLTEGSNPEEKIDYSQAAAIKYVALFTHEKYPMTRILAFYHLWPEAIQNAVFAIYKAKKSTFAHRVLNAATDADFLKMKDKPLAQSNLLEICWKHGIWKDLVAKPGTTNLLIAGVREGKFDRDTVYSLAVNHSKHQKTLMTFIEKLRCPIENPEAEKPDEAETEIINTEPQISPQHTTSNAMVLPTTINLSLIKKGLFLTAPVTGDKEAEKTAKQLWKKLEADYSAVTQHRNDAQRWHAVNKAISAFASCDHYKDRKDVQQVYKCFHVAHDIYLAGKQSIGEVGMALVMHALLSTQEDNFEALGTTYKALDMKARTDHMETKLVELKKLEKANVTKLPSTNRTKLS